MAKNKAVILIFKCFSFFMPHNGISLVKRYKQIGSGVPMGTLGDNAA